MSEADEIFLNFPAHSIMQQSDFSPTKFLHSASHLTDKFSIWKDFLSEICGFFVFRKIFSVDVKFCVLFLRHFDCSRKSILCSAQSPTQSHASVRQAAREEDEKEKNLFLVAKCEKKINLNSSNWI